jgi:hypothetical protein
MMETVRSCCNAFWNVELDARAFDDCNVVAVDAVTAHAILRLGVYVESLASDSD